MNCKILTKEELYTLYVSNNLTIHQICDMYNLTFMQIRYALNKYKIVKDKKRSQSVLKNKNKHVNHTLIINNKDLLYQKYIVENLTRVEIANLDNVSEALVKKRIIQYNLQKNNELRTKNSTKGCKDKRKQMAKARAQTCLKKYGVPYYFLANDFKEKAHKSLIKNKSWNASRPEEQIYALLSTKFPNTKRQYKSEKYPFNCDFYIPELDLYIEYQGYWTHEKEPFNPKNKYHLKKLLKWKEKTEDSYKNAINVWTIRDPLKRKTAKENKLNWLEFFNMNTFMAWYNEN